MKRSISIILTIVMLIGMLSVLTSAALPFTDVKEKAYYYAAVEWAVDKGVTAGITPTSFAPNQNCTRGQVVTFLWRAVGSPEPTKTTHPFTDVKEKAFYYKAMLWAVEKGVTSGLSATTFGPNESCTRGQVVSFLHRVAGKVAPTTTNHPFTDVKAKAFYYTSMLWAVEKGITSGLSATTFGPNAVCTRGQIVTFLYKYVTTATPETPAPETPNPDIPVPETPGTTLCEHAYDNDCDTTCNKCNTSRTAPHKYDYNCDKECNLCGAKRDVKHEYPLSGYSYDPCKHCGNPHVKLGSISLDKDYVKVGETFTASVDVSGGVAPYTVTWYYTENGYSNGSQIKIDGVTTTPGTITATADMFNEYGNAAIYCSVTDAEGRSASPMDTESISKKDDLSVVGFGVAQPGGNKYVTDYELSVFSNKAPFIGSVDVAGLPADDCTYKWEWSREKNGTYVEMTNNTSAGIYLSSPNYVDETAYFIATKEFLDSPVYIRVTVSADGETPITTEGQMFYRELSGSTAAGNNESNPYGDPFFICTPRGGNGTYTIMWGFTAAGRDYNFEGQINSSYYSGQGTKQLDIERADYLKMKDQWDWDGLWVKITSAGKSETIHINFK